MFQKTAPLRADGPRRTLADDFSALYKSKARTDLSVVVEGAVFQAHRLVLETRSKVFAVMLTSDMQEGKSDKITVQDMKKDIFEVGGWVGDGSSRCLCSWQLLKARFLRNLALRSYRLAKATTCPKFVVSASRNDIHCCNDPQVSPRLLVRVPLARASVARKVWPARYYPRYSW